MANAVWINRATATTWLSTGGSAVLTLTSLASGAGRQGAMATLTDPGPKTFVWRAWVKFATTPVVGEVIEIYAKTSDGSHYDNDDGTGDAAVSAQDKLRNLGDPIGVIIVDEASTTPEFSASGTIEIHATQFAPVFWNATADALSATAADHGFQLLPAPDEIQ